MFVFSLILIAVLAVVDQLIKYIVVQNIQLYDVIDVIKIGSHKIFSLTHIRNSGAAWSIMSGKSWFLIGLPIVVIALGIYYLFKIRKKSKFEIITLAMLISGGIGNLIDRIRFNEVVDYIQFNPINFPVFNFADICVVVGGILFCFHFIVVEELRKHKEKRTDLAENSDAKS